MTLAAVNRRRPVTASPDPIEARFCSLERHVAELESRLTAVEPLTDAEFLKAVATSVKGRVFNTLELRRHARVDSDLRRALGTHTNLQLGKKLERLAGRPIGGFVLQRIKRDETGVLWAVGLADLHDDAGADDDHGA
jgi:hypothetical protein